MLGRFHKGKPVTLIKDPTGAYYIEPHPGPKMDFSPLTLPRCREDFPNREEAFQWLLATQRQRSSCREKY